MSNWYGTCRSNYFHVKSVDEFTTWLAQFPDAVLINDTEGRVGFYSNGEGYIPTIEYDGDGEPIPLDLDLHTHLAPNEVAIIMEAGAEKARYVTGFTLAIHSSGERITINLNDIYELAQTTFGDEAQITEAIY